MRNCPVSFLSSSADFEIYCFALTFNSRVESEARRPRCKVFAGALCTHRSRSNIRWRWLSTGSSPKFVQRQCSWPLATLWLTDELIQSAPACKYAFVDSKQNSWPCCFRKQKWSALGLCRSNREFEFTWCFYFACLCGRSYLSPCERSVVAAAAFSIHYSTL